MLLLLVVVVLVRHCYSFQLAVSPDSSTTVSARRASQMTSNRQGRWWPTAVPLRRRRRKHC